MKIKDYLNIFEFHGRGLYALNRMFDTFLEIQLFDIFRNVDTSTIKTDSHSDHRYMIYQPVYTSICKEMIRKSFEWYSSGVKYSNNNLIPVFCDLGSGSGKTVLLAKESGLFDFCVGIELDEELHKRAERNFSCNRFANKKNKFSNILGNVEDDYWIKSICDELPVERVPNIVLFAFNKNSYNYEVLSRTLELMEKSFNNIVYLYQNPIHHTTLLASGFEEVQRDAQKNNSHKNKKYTLYHYKKNISVWPI